MTQVLRQRPNGFETSQETQRNEVPPQTTESRPAERIVIRLKVERQKKSVTWDEENAPDNEFKDTKSSKCCCIFHRRKQFGESDTESDNDSLYSDDSDSEHEEHAPGCHLHSHNS